MSASRGVRRYQSGMRKSVWVKGKQREVWIVELPREQLQLTGPQVVLFWGRVRSKWRPNQNVGLQED